MTGKDVTPTSPKSTYSYSYGDADWGDKLTAYRGQSITYDEIGNPLSYYNGKRYTFTWENGRRLATAEVGENVVSFRYNDEGIRTGKNVNGVEHSYSLNGSQIIMEDMGGSLLVYLYDASGSPIGMQYRNRIYDMGAYDNFWFEKNLQGDIVAVYDEDGTKLISYTYDAWGNFTTTYHNGCTASHIANLNPFRYRGYYYDSETGSLPFCIKKTHRLTPFGASRCVFSSRISQGAAYFTPALQGRLPLPLWYAAKGSRR